MSIPILYDTILNDYFKSQYVTLLPGDGVVGHKKFDGPRFIYQEWHPIPGPNGGVALLNKGTGTYLVPGGGYIISSDEKYYWQLVPKAAPLPGYYFETTDRQLAWFLPSGTDGTWIELKPVVDIHGKEDQEKAEWVWKKA